MIFASDLHVGQVLKLSNNDVVMVIERNNWGCAGRYSLVSLVSGLMVLMDDHMNTNQIEKRMKVKVVK